MWEDPIVAEIHRIREEISARHNHDLAAICRAAKEEAHRSGRTLITAPPKQVPNTTPPESAQ